MIISLAQYTAYVINRFRLRTMFDSGVFINRTNQSIYDVSDFLQSTENVTIEIPTLSGIETEGIPLPYMDDMTMYSRHDGVMTLRKSELGNYYWDLSPDLRTHTSRNNRVPFTHEIITEYHPPATLEEASNVVNFSLYDYILENFRIHRMRLCDVTSCVTRNATRQVGQTNDTFVSWDANRFLRLCKEIKQQVVLADTPHAKTFFWQSAHSQMWNWCFQHREVFLVTHDEWLHLYPIFTRQGYSIATKVTSVRTYDNAIYQDTMSHEMRDVYGLQSR